MRRYLRAANVKWDGLDLSDLNEMAFTETESKTYELLPGDLLLGEASGSPSEVGKPGQYKGEIDGCCFQNTLLRVRLPNGLLPDFYEHYFREQALNGRFAAGSRGVGIHHLGAAALSDWQVPLPPTPEQERIVAAIEEAFSKLDAGEAGLRTVRQRLKRMRDAVLTAAVTGRLVPQDPTDTPSTKLLVDLGVEPDRSVEGLPVGWEAVTLDDILQGIEAGKSFATQGHPARRGEMGVIKVSAMTWGEFRPGENKALPTGTVIEQRWIVQAGDLLLSRANTADYVGACVLVQTNHPELILSDKSLRLVPANGIEPRWLLHALRSRPARAQIEQLATGTKDSMRNISQAKLRSLQIFLPPTDEQRRIAEELERQFSTIEACQRAIDVGLARSSALRRSVLKAAFEGKLVDQDPSDEPASDLLERIRAEHSSAPPARRRSRANA
jgi:type I restriction enzyme, S subunit